MREWESVEKISNEDLEKRLGAYYGPQLREQPLSQTSWLRLRNQLGSQRSGRRWRLRRPRLHQLRRFRSVFVPVSVQEAFGRIAFEARVQYPSSLLHCTVSPRVRMPSVRVFLSNRRAIRLTLPPNFEQLLERSELDVVLATGLARYRCLKRSGFVLACLLLIGFVLVCVMGLLWWWLQSRSPFVFLIAIILCMCVLGVVHVVGRRVAFEADKLMVLWLGRSCACQGLHALADRSRRPSRRGWREPSLAERIERVCGTRVEVGDERLTLVR
mgnify:CR=1 FL=1